MDGHIPDGGLDHAIAGAAGETHQPGEALLMAPEAHPEQAVLQRLAHPAHGPAAPADRIAELLQFKQVDLPLAAQHQGQFRVNRAAEAMLAAVHPRQGFGLGDLGVGGAHH